MNELDISETRRENLQRLITLRAEGNQAAFAGLVRRTPAVIWQYLSRRREMGEKLARHIEKCLRLPVGWMDHPHDAILEGELVPSGLLPRPTITPEDIIQAIPGAHPVIFWETADDLPDGQYIHVPFYEAHFAAGSGQIVVADPPKMRTLAFMSDWAKQLRLRADRCIVVLAKGDSMEPTLNDGAALLVNLDDAQIRDGQMYALRYGDDLRIKRLYRRYDGGLILRSDNRVMYPDELVPPADQDGHVHVFGRVIQWSCQAD